MSPTTLIIRTAGTNCDRELKHAFELAGAQTRTVHLNRLIEEPAVIDDVQLIGVPGGFSFGDDIAAGRIFANRLRHRLYDPLHRAIDRGTPIIGICNGFQVLTKLGLLPDPAAPDASPDAAQTATLADNTSGRFVDRWVKLNVPAETACIWTRGIGELELPVAHGEGRFVPGSEALLKQWRDRGQIAIRYDAHDNPNGSVADIAGVCDTTGLVLGLMPHPERFVDVTQHPAWTRLSREARQFEPAGLRIIRNAVDHVKAGAAAV